jgi:hypothetical protein
MKRDPRWDWQGSRDFWRPADRSSLLIRLWPIAVLVLAVLLLANSGHIV